MATAPSHAGRPRTNSDAEFAATLSPNHRRRWHLEDVYSASTPASQLAYEQDQEARRMLDAVAFAGPVEPDHELHTLAALVVYERWRDQGIYRDEWSVEPAEAWKHELPRPLAADQDGIGHRAPTWPPRDEAEEDLLEEMADLRLAGFRRERERDASRPLQRFVYQMAVERERMQQDEWLENHGVTKDRLAAVSPAGVGAGYEALVLGAAKARLAQASELASRHNQGHDLFVGLPPPPPDAHSIAYERVKADWEARGLWDARWGAMPGPAWKHEEPLEDMLRREMGDDYVTLEDMYPGLYPQPPARRPNGRLNMFGPDLPDDLPGGTNTNTATPATTAPETPTTPVLRVTIRREPAHYVDPFEDPPSPRQPLWAEPRQHH